MTAEGVMAMADVLCPLNCLALRCKWSGLKLALSLFAVEKGLDKLGE